MYELIEPEILYLIPIQFIGNMFLSCTVLVCCLMPFTSGSLTHGEGQNNRLVIFKNKKPFCRLSVCVGDNVSL